MLGWTFTFGHFPETMIRVVESSKYSMSIWRGAPCTKGVHIANCKVLCLLLLLLSIEYATDCFLYLSGGVQDGAESPNQKAIFGVPCNLFLIGA